MRIRLAILFDRFSRFGAWIAVAGTFLLVGGLAWDVSIHEASPGLADHESVFTIDNPAHIIFLTGIGLIVVGMLGFFGGQVRASRSTRRVRFVSVTAVAIAGQPGAGWLGGERPPKSSLGLLAEFLHTLRPTAVPTVKARSCADRCRGTRPPAARSGAMALLRMSGAGAG